MAGPYAFPVTKKQQHLLVKNNTGMNESTSFKSKKMQVDRISLKNMQSNNC